MSGTETKEGKHTSQTELALLMSAVTLTGYLFIDLLRLQLSTVFMGSESAWLSYHYSSILEQ